jgi:hypothetical protein
MSDVLQEPVVHDFAEKMINNYPRNAAKINKASDMKA